MSRLRIIVQGYVIRGPLGGMVWSDLHYLMGLAELGHDVYFLEDSDDYPSCYDPTCHLTTSNPTYGLAFASQVFKKLGHADKWAYFDAHEEKWHGPCGEVAIEVCRTADLLLNCAAVNPMRDWTRRIPVRAFIDQDPAFTQIRNLTDSCRREFAEEHNRFFTFGENIPSGHSEIPSDGFDWQATRQPVALAKIEPLPGPITGKLSTVMQWNSYQGQIYDGVKYGMKSDSFEDFISLPSEVGPIFELAVGSANTETRRLLKKYGWQLRDSLEVSQDPWSYEKFIKNSKAEFGIAKHGYVVSRSGWFSERSVTYLASGRPVIVQDTGFTQWLDADMGVKSFSTADEAISAIEEVNRDYEAHCRVAREVAAEYFDSRKVLAELIEKASEEPVEKVL